MAPQPRATPTPDEVSAFAARYDALPLSWAHVGVLVLAATALSFDLWEIALNSVLSTFLSSNARINHSLALPMVVTSVFFGGMVGSPVLGWVADRWGRRRTMMASLVWMGVCTALAPVREDLSWLIAFRMLSGLALGAFPPILMAYLAEIVPPDRRAGLLVGSTSLASLGAPAALFMTRWMDSLQPLGIEGWRWGFMLGGGGAIVLGLFFLLLPETPRWLFARGERAKAEALFARFEASPPVPLVGRRSLIRSEQAAGRKPTAVATAVLMGIWALSPWVNGSFPIMSAAILVQKGFGVEKTLLYVGLLSVGPMLGGFITAPVLDLGARRRVLAALSVLIGVAGILFVAATGPRLLLCAGVLFNVLGTVLVPVLFTYTGELYPTDQRARMAAFGWAANRLGSCLAPFVLLPILHAKGPTAVTGVMVVAIASTILLLNCAPPGRERRSVA
ncbi:MAG: MFS transporter [Caulobacter sp.]|nr:MFS transporter [Caulobacter sp.]